MKLSLLSLLAAAVTATSVHTASSADIPKLNLTAATTINDVGVIQCWQLELKEPAVQDKATIGYRLGDFSNTTLITVPHTHFPGELAESYSLLTIVRGAIRIPSVGYTLEPGRDSTLILAIKGPGSPKDFSTVIEGPLYALQQYTDTIPDHTVLYDGHCREDDLPK